MFNKSTDKQVQENSEDEDSVRVKLSIRPDSKVCLFHANKDILPNFMKGDLKLMIDWAENDCDSILYWIRPQDILQDIMSHLERQIKTNGKIWLVIKKDYQNDKTGMIQEEVTSTTNLKKGKTVDIGNGETALQFLKRKETKQ